MHRVWLGLFGAFAVTTVHADPYPLEHVDRPLVLLPGMTTLDMSEDLPTYVNTTVDAMGNSTTTTTTLGDKNVFDLTVSHAFGPVQVTARIVDIDTSLTARIETGIPGALTLGVAYGHSIGSSNYFGSQSIGYSYKRVVMPRRLALAGSVGTGLYEEDFVSNQQLRIVGHVVDVSVNAGPEIQLSRRVALAGTIGVSVAAEHSSSIAVTTFVVANANVLVAFRRCDLYAAFELDSLTDHVHPWAALGIVIRFGTLAG